MALNGTSSRRHAWTSSASVGHTRQDGAAAANLRPEPELAELEDPERDVVSQRQFAVDLGRGVEEHLGVDPGRLDGLDPRVGRRKLAGVEHDREPQRLVTELGELRGRANEAIHDPAGLARAHAAMLGEPFVERQLLGRKRRRVVDQPAEEGAPRICQRLGQPAVM